jgi:hypothetical protein
MAPSLRHPRGSLESFVERTAPEVVPATDWFDSPPEPAVQTVTIRFTGHRLSGGGPPKQGDEFSHDETIKGVVAGSGPVVVTVKFAT